MIRKIDVGSVFGTAQRTTKPVSLFFANIYLMSLISSWVCWLG